MRLGLQDRAERRLRLDLLAYDVHGKASHLNLRKLPRQLNVPPAATDITAAYHAVGSTGSGSSRTPLRSDRTRYRSGGAVAVEWPRRSELSLA